MSARWWTREPETTVATARDRIRQRYERCRELIALNNECLEMIAGLQEDLSYVPPLRDVVGGRIAGIFERAGAIVSLLERLAARQYPSLHATLQVQQQEIEAFISSMQERVRPRLAARLSEVGLAEAPEVGGKTAALGEVRRRLGFPVPEGFVLTTEAYWMFCGVPYWERIRDALRRAAVADLDALETISIELTALVAAAPLPRAVEVALVERGQALARDGGLAVRSSACGEGERHSFAGQFDSRINVPAGRIVDAYKRVIASRFSQRALSYRLATGLSEVESPMAVLVLPTLRARASGILYTRDPANPRSRSLWITATWGLGLGLAGGSMAGDLFVVSRARPHDVIEQRVAPKPEEITLNPGGGVVRRPIDGERAAEPSLEPAAIAELARMAVAIEKHFRAPQDVEWVLDERGDLWILQTRPLATADAAPSRLAGRVAETPIASGGYTIYPGRVSGAAFVVETRRSLDATPDGAILFVHRPGPEIVKVLPRVAGLVADSGNVTGHGAALLREFKVPSVFEMPGAFASARTGDAVSLDSGRAAVYAGALWPAPRRAGAGSDRDPRHDGDPIHRRLLVLNLLDPSSFRFRPSGCRSAHDVIRFCHERAIEEMFSLNDRELGHGAYQARRLMTPAPVNFHVLDLGGGMAMADPDAPEVEPAEIASRPFQALWKGVTHPGVTWRREMPASFAGLASVMASGLSSTASSARRALGEKSYLLITDEYMNLNSRLAYHFSLVDALVSAVAGNNYVFFRFAGGAATEWRRSLRAAMIEAILGHYGFHVDRRGDLVNAWFKKARAADTEERLDILGRLMACTSQLDMYMTSTEVMRWYVRQFLEGNYSFLDPTAPDAAGPAGAPGG